MIFEVFLLAVLSITVIQSTLNKCNEMQQSSAQGTTAVAIPMLSMRFFANAFKGKGSSVAVASNLGRYAISF